jgi:hypothetical protein
MQYSAFKWWLYTTNSDNVQLGLLTAKRQIGVTKTHLGWKTWLFWLTTIPRAWEKPQQQLTYASPVENNYSTCLWILGGASYVRHV